MPRGQWEAAAALGLHRSRCSVEGDPAAGAIVALRPLGNEVILMIKGSAVASIVTVFDLMGETRLAFSRTYDLSVYL